MLNSYFLLWLLAAICEISSVNAQEESEAINERSFDSAHDARAEILSEAFESSNQIVEERQYHDRKLAEEGKVISLNERRTDPSLIRNFRVDPRIHTLELINLPFEKASLQLYEKLNVDADVIASDFPSIDLTGELQQFQDACKREVTTAECDANSKYRTIGGQCNNLQNPRWGSALNCQPRLLFPNYAGISDFRTSVNGEPLPRPRELSLNVHYDLNRHTHKVSHMYMFFGQLLDHDITQTPQSTADNNKAMFCCPPTNENHPQCAPILVSKDDPFYSQFNITCINFVRSVACPTCTLGPRQLMNQVTSTIDASFVYGNFESRTNFLRANDGTGQLRTQNSKYGKLMPRSSDPRNDQCSYPETNDICFEAGDSRANQHTVLTSLHTTFVLEHNRIATELRKINPHWGDEKLFQEARRIVGAEMQMITYKEYLPITLGREAMSDFDLWTGSRTTYDPNEDPTTMIEFTSAAFRFGHSLINSFVTSRPLNASNQLRYLRNEFFQPFDLYRGYAGPLMAGASNSPAQRFDRHLVPDVTEFLYRVRGAKAGLDLAAININRGRDHGLPTYVETVRNCTDGEINIKKFRDLVKYGLMRRRQAEVLQDNYKFVDDIDLWPGILSEIPDEGAVVGPTAVCIIGLQFYKMKYGDRFYFEHKKQAGSFKNNQLRQLRNVTLSQIICLTTKVRRMPRNAMLFRSNVNPYIECGDVEGIDLSYWKE